MTEYQYHINKDDLATMPSPLMDLCQKAMRRQFRQIEDKLTELLPEHLRDGHDIPAANAWFQEHGVTLSNSTDPYDMTKRITYPAYLDRPSKLPPIPDSGQSSATTP